MGAMTDHMENKIVDWFFRGESVTPPATLYAALFTDNPDDTGGSVVEVSGGSYARVAIAASLANWAGTQGAGTTTASSGTSGTTSNNAALEYADPTADWGTIVGVGLYDASSGGTLWLYGALAVPRVVNNGDPGPIFKASELSFSIDT